MIDGVSRLLQQHNENHERLGSRPNCGPIYDSSAIHSTAALEATQAVV
jgi:hypothetical protein